MLLDLVQEYDDTKKQYLHDLRKDVLLHTAQTVDPKKIVSFLNKVWILAIDENEKAVYIGVANDFVLTQVRKFFAKPIKEAIQTVYNEHFSPIFVVYTPFAKNHHDLLVNLKKLFVIKEETPEAMPVAEVMKKQLSSFFGNLFDPAFTFDNLVTGSHNAFAVNAAKAIVENPGNAYNPLFLYGSVGLGKTHLMQAIGNEVMKNNPKAVVLYLPTSKFIDEIVQAIKNNKINVLIDKFNDVDVLLLDDVQFLANKERTQEIFHNIFNELHTQRKQIVLTSDRPPKELINIEPRLKSRFGLGVVVDISVPDYETRLAILHHKIAQKDIYIDDILLGIIAEHVKGNVRELEGCLNTLITKKTLLGKDITEVEVYDCLDSLGFTVAKQQHQSFTPETNTRGAASFATVVEMVANYYTISVADIKSDSRKKEISTARQILMYLAKKHFSWTLEKIGNYFGGKDHSGVIYAVDNIEKKIKTDENIAHDVRIFTEWVG